VHVQVAAQVGALDQRRQSARGGGLDLAAVLAQFGRNPGQPERGVDLLLGRARATAPALEQTVLVELHALCDGQVAQPDVVRLRAGEVHQRRTAACRRDHAQVDLQAVAQHHRRARLAGLQHLRHLRMAHQLAADCAAVGRGDEQVQVADGLAPAPQAAGGHRVLHPRRLPQEPQQRLGGLRGDDELEALFAACPLVDRGGDALLGLRAKAGQRADAPVVRGAAQLRQRVHVQVLVQRAHPLGPETGQLQQRVQPRGHLAHQAIEQGEMPGRGQLADLVAEVGTDAGQLGQAAAGGDLGDQVELEFADYPCGVAIGAHAERIRIAQLEQIRHPLERGRDVGIAHCHGLDLRPARRGTLERGQAAAAARCRRPAATAWSGMRCR
jgi:hypothetical protein